MKTTVDLPDQILQQAKIAAVQRRKTLRELIIQGLEAVLSEPSPDRKAGALERLERGLRLEGKPLTRQEVYERKPVS